MRSILRQATYLALISAGLIGPSYAIAPFTANYEFTYNHKLTAPAVRKLSQQGDQWVYEFSAKVPVLATASEKSTFKMVNNQVVAQSFQQQWKLPMVSQVNTVLVNNTAKTITTSKNNKPRQLTWQAGVMDDLNVEIQIREDLKRGGLKAAYPVAGYKEVTQRVFINEGHAKVTTPAGTFDTIRVRLDPTKKDRKSTFWLAPSLDYLPVQMAYTENNTDYSLVLTKIAK